MPLSTLANTAMAPRAAPELSRNVSIAAEELSAEPEATHVRLGLALARPAA